MIFMGVFQMALAKLCSMTLNNIRSGGVDLNSADVFSCEPGNSLNAARL
jgi:hypothetical protein